jgi:hypothetical protein
MGDLTANFSAKEFLAYDNGKRYFSPESIPEWSYKLDLLRFLCHTILQPIRDIHGPLSIHSGYRSPEWNLTVGGSRTSDHMWPAGSCCADIVPASGDRLAVIAWTLDKLPWAFGELILYADTNHFHVGLPTVKDHGQLLFVHKARKVTLEVPWRGDPQKALRELRALIAQYPR